MIAPESRIPRNTPERLATNYTNSHEIFSARQWVYAPRIANGAFSKRVIRLSFFRAIRGIRGQAFSNLLQCHVSLARGDHFRPGTPAPFPARDGLGSGDLLRPGVISAVRFGVRALACSVQCNLKAELQTSHQ